MNSVTATVEGTLIMLDVVFMGAVICRVIPFYSRELAGDVGRRELSLDGVRGLAALIVLTHHSVMFHNGLASGQWGDAGSTVLRAFGPAGVDIFFMLTGCLFWGKARAAGGKLEAWQLWRGRLRRIAPLYLFSALLVLIIAAMKLGPEVLLTENRRSVLRVLGLGIFRWHEGAFDPGEINAHVVWTLWCEWRFYLALPFIAWLAPKRRVFWVVPMVFGSVFAGVYWRGIVVLQFGLIFLQGMICPVLLDDKKLREKLCQPAAAGVALAATLLFALVVPCEWSSFPFAATLFPVFLVSAAGNSFWGILTSRAMRCLGTISYSLYLLHGIIFFIAVGMIRAGGWTALPNLWYALILLVTAAATTWLCAATYRWIEFPFLVWSRRKPAAATFRTDLQTGAPSI